MNAFVIIGGVLGVLLLSMSWTKVLLICLGIVAILLAILVASQEKMLYMPEVQGFTTVGSNPPGMRSPAELDMKFENIKVATADGQSIHAWFIHAIGVADSSVAPTIVFCHANAGNMGLRMPNYRQLASFVKADVLAFDYRGFGESTGKPSEEGIMLDLDALFQWIQNNQQLVDPENIFLFGRSLVNFGFGSESHKIGRGAVAAEYAAKLVAEGHPPRGVILENTFLSISLMVNSLFPFLRFDWVKKPFLRLRWETYKHVEKLGKKTSVLLLSAADDEIVPPSHMTKLHDICNDNGMECTFERFENATHNDTWQKGGRRYLEVLKKFVNDRKLAPMPKIVEVE